MQATSFQDIFGALELLNIYSTSTGSISYTCIDILVFDIRSVKKQCVKNCIFQAISRSFLKLFGWSYDLYFAATYIKKIHHVISDHKKATGLLDGTYRQVNKPWPDNWRFFLF